MAIASTGPGFNYNTPLKSFPEAKPIISCKRGELADMLIAACQAREEFNDELMSSPRPKNLSEAALNPDKYQDYLRRRMQQDIARTVVEHLVARKLPQDRRVGDLLHKIIHPDDRGPTAFVSYTKAWLDFMETMIENEPLPPAWVETCRLLHQHESKYEYTAQERKLNDRLAKLAGVMAEEKLPLVPGDAWSDAAICDLEAVRGDDRAAWLALLNHAKDLSAAKPSKKWRKQGQELVEQIGSGVFIENALTWSEQIGQPGTVAHEVGWDGHTDHTRLDARNADIVRGLCWLMAPHAQSAASLCDTVIVCCKKLRGELRCEPVANAAIRALASMSGETGLIQLVQLELLIRAPKPKKLIVKMIAEAAEREGLDATRLQESAVPDFGLVDGVVGLAFGDFTARIEAVGDKAHIGWIKPDGSTTRVIPKAVKQIDPDAGEQVKALAKQLETILPAQRARLERLMKADRAWQAELWQSDFLNHGLVFTFARRLIWEIDNVPCLWHDGAMRDVEGNPIEVSGEVRLWHPIGRSTEEIVAWRGRVEALEITQPFKQAHREVYLVTDAELNTGTYSNRFAAHILKNTAMVALCQTRGWVTGLFGGETGPRLELPGFGVRAEFWVEPASDDYTDFGAPVYLATDQVRFYALADADSKRLGHSGELNEPLPIELVPPMALTETLRDVDMFVGICSVGNNPEWSDGGPDNRFRDYWHDYSFGDLTATAQTRKELLGRLVPRLKIADRCSFSARFLVVRGDLRTYKIHLGSGNIQMEPNDQYLCIVPGRGDEPTGSSGKVFLPFEGDRTLSIILSKAFMLAEDTKITDTTILSQIGS